MTALDRIEALHPKFADSDHCAEDGHPYPCPTLVEVRAALADRVHVEYGEEASR